MLDWEREHALIETSDCGFGDGMGGRHREDGHDADERRSCGLGLR